MTSTDDASIEQEQRYRASAWALLAALLRAAPDRALLDHVGKLSPEGDDESGELHGAMSNPCWKRNSTTSSSVSAGVKPFPMGPGT